MNIRSIALAAALSLLVASANASTVTWQFVEHSDGVSGPIGATLTLNSPPVNLTPGVSWTATTADVVDFTILDSNIGPVGPYDIDLNVASILEGVGPNFINIDEVSGQDASGNVAFSNINETLNASDLGVGLANGGFATVNGDWVLQAGSVPEPSSLLLGGSAAVVTLAMCARRRRNRP